MIEWEFVTGCGAKRQGNGERGFLLDQRVAEQTIEHDPNIVAPTRE